ncbi:MAG: V-type ATP synthase subunit D [Candidatus Aminicenantes bacterium]|nr:V-type ATP synthase subunit D [Candidatus Aminicenantes bacterium]
MALKFQYNKTALQAIDKQLRVRVRALPTLKNKESALRFEVLKARERAQALDLEIETRLAESDKMARLWTEFDPSLVRVRDVAIQTRKIAGVKIPVPGEIDWETRDFNLFTAPAWALEGVRVLKDISRLQIERRFFVRKMQILDHVRKKTTQKVNLYEKVQIPAFEDAILKIKRFLEDEDNLSKAAQKILKNRLLSESAP